MIQIRIAMTATTNKRPVQTPALKISAIASHELNETNASSMNKNVDNRLVFISCFSDDMQKPYLALLRIPPAYLY